MSENIIGEYPYSIEERDNELVVHFESKENPTRGTVFNLRFKVSDRYRRNRIKELMSELSKIET